MITITRKQAHTVRSVFRRALGITASSRAPAVTLETDSSGLLIRAHKDAIGIEYNVPGEFGSERVDMPFQALADCEGRDNSPVEFEHSGNQAAVHWTDKNVPCVVTHEMLEADNRFPALPTSMSVSDPHLLAALREAMETTDPGATRYALGSVQLRGMAGDIAATDGHQLLLETGFTFPWDDDVLVPANPAFASSEFLSAKTLELGRTDRHVVFRAGSWTLWLPTAEGRFPKVDDIVPAVETATVSLELADDDSVFLLNAIKHLPAGDDSNLPVTIDANGHVALLAKDDKHQLTQVVLTNSRHEGADTRISTNRQYLAKAVRLGFRRVYLRGSESPLFCCDDRRRFLWMPLEKGGIIKPTKTMTRIESPPATRAAATTPAANSPVDSIAASTPQPTESPPQTPATPIHDERSQPAMTTSRNVQDDRASEADTGSKANGETVGLESLLADVEKLKGTLREAQTQLTTLASCLKRHRKQSKLVQSTLASLRQLQSLDA